MNLLKQVSSWVFYYRKLRKSLRGLLGTCARMLDFSRDNCSWLLASLWRRILEDWKNRTINILTLR
jgi:hypothetical protein